MSFLDKSKEECFVCGKAIDLSTHGYIEKDNTKHWEFICFNHHSNIHPEFVTGEDKAGEN